MKRVVIIGTTGAGKTTLAKHVAQRFGYPHVELDALFWEPDWKEAETRVFRERVAAALSGECWVADGNYTSKVVDIVWPRADTLVWLDYSLAVTMWRLILRTIRRVVQHERLWGGNQEDLRILLFTRRSLVLWALKSHGRHRRQFAELFGQPEYAHLHVVHLRSSRETQEWFVRLK